MGKTVKSIKDYQVGIVCALPKERAAVEALLDGEHDPQSSIENDRNVYTYGEIAKHNVVIASLRHGSYGTVSAANVTGDIRRSFPQLRLCLMVGIAGAMPRPKAKDGDIRLGDIVVGSASNVSSVVNYTAGKNTPDGFELRGDLPEPPEILLNAIGALDAQHRRKGPTYLTHLSNLFRQNPRMNKPRLIDDYYNQPAAVDKLVLTGDNFEAQRKDRIQRNPPDGLEDERFIRKREEDGDTEYAYPHVHYGTIASADVLMKHAAERDTVYELVLKQRNAKVLCFEMEASGIVKGWPCLVIRGICDYCDENKNDDWQNFASATAAAYAKDLLTVVPPEIVQKTETVEKAIEKAVPNVTNNNNSGGVIITNNGSGSSNINTGSGSQRNYTQTGSHNKQFNGDTMHFRS